MRDILDYNAQNSNVMEFSQITLQFAMEKVLVWVQINVFAIQDPLEYNVMDFHVMESTQQVLVFATTEMEIAQALTTVYVVQNIRDCNA